MTDERPRGIGASQVPGIAGASPWTTPVGVWLDVTGMAARSNDSPSMAAGRALERPVLRMTAGETGRTIRHNRRRFFHPDYPRVPLWATPDGFTDGRRELVEVKFVGHRWADWADGPPAYVNLQVQAQLCCLPRVRSGIVAALVGGDLRIYRVERDPAIQEALPGLVADWYARHVLGDRAPDAEGPDDRWALLRIAAATGARPERAPTDDEATIAAELLALTRHRDAVDEQIEDRRLRLAESATGADLVGDGWRARWGTRRSTNWAGFVDEEPVRVRLGPEMLAELVERNTSTTTTFTFRRTKSRADEARVEVLGFVPNDLFRMNGGGFRG